MMVNKICSKIALYFLFFYFQINFIICQSEIKLKYDDYGRPISSVCLGSKSLCLSMRVDTDYIDTLVHSSSSNKKDIKNKYDPSVSKKSSIVKKDVEIEYKSQKLKADFIRDTMVIDSIEIKKGLFFSIKEGDCEDLDKTEGILGLGLATTADQEKNSAMTQLYVNGFFDSKIWTIDLSDKKNGYIKPNKVVDSKSVGTDLELTKNEEGHWLVNIKYILLGKNIEKDDKFQFDSDTQMKISTSEIKSSINIEILKKIGDSYFKKLVDSSECKFDTKGKYSTYICKKNNYEELTIISLIFNDFGINIPKESILVKKDKEYEFFLSNYDGDKNNVLGIDVLKGKKLVFDCEKMLFGLYGENMFDTTKVNEEEKPKDDDPIIPKEEEKEDEKEKDKEKEKIDENKNQNTNNDNNKKNEENLEKESKAGMSTFKKILIFFVVALVLCFLWTLYKRYKKRNSKNKFPFKSYNDINLNGIQLVSD